MSKTIYATIARANPPTAGHEFLFEQVKTLAESNSADARIFITQRTDYKKNPLNWEEKIKLIEESMPSCSGIISKNQEIRNIFDGLKLLESEGYTDVKLVVGEDRKEWFGNLVEQYNGVEFNFNTITAISAGDRLDEGEGIESISATKARKAIVDRDFNTFRSMLPSTLKENYKQALKVYDDVSLAMLVEDCESDEEKFIQELEEFIDQMSDQEVEEYLDESDIQEDNQARMLFESDMLELEDSILEEAVISKQERIKRSLRMKRLSKKIHRRAEMAKKRMPSSEQLDKRARRAAINIMKTRIAKKPISGLSPAEKERVETLLKKRMGAVKRLSIKLVPKLRSASKERIIASRAKK